MANVNATSAVDTMDDMIVLRNRSFHGPIRRPGIFDRAANDSMVRPIRFETLFRAITDSPTARAFTELGRSRPSLPFAPLHNRRIVLDSIALLTSLVQIRVEPGGEKRKIWQRRRHADDLNRIRIAFTRIPHRHELDFGQQKLDQIPA